MNQGTLFVLAATFGLALKGIWARLAYEAGASVEVVVFYRSLLSAPLTVLMGWVLLRRESSPMKLSWREHLPGCALGLLFAGGMVLDFIAIERLGAGVSRVILFGFPLGVMVLEALKERRLPPHRRLSGFFLAWLGLAAVAWGKPGVGAENLSAQVPWALGSMIVYALYVFLSGSFTKRVGSVRLSLGSNLSTAALIVSVTLLKSAGDLPEVSSRALLWVALMVLVSTVVPYFLLMEGIKKLGASNASLLAMSGPVVTLLAASLILSEQLSLTQCLGAGLTLVGVGAAQGKFSLLWTRGARGPCSALGADGWSSKHRSARCDPTPWQHRAGSLRRQPHEQEILQELRPVSRRR